MQSPIDKEISRSHITEIVLFPCFHHLMDGHSLSLSLALSLQSPGDRDISRSCMMEIVTFLCFHYFTNAHSLSLSLRKYVDLVLQREYHFCVFTVS